MHPKHGTRAFLRTGPIGTLPLRSRIEPASSSEAEQLHSRALSDRGVSLTVTNALFQSISIRGQRAPSAADYRPFAQCRLFSLEPSRPDEIAHEVITSITPIWSRIHRRLGFAANIAYSAHTHAACQPMAPLSVIYSPGLFAFATRNSFARPGCISGAIGVRDTAQRDATLSPVLLGLSRTSWHFQRALGRLSDFAEEGEKAGRRRGQLAFIRVRIRTALATFSMLIALAATWALGYAHYGEMLPPFI